MGETFTRVGNVLLLTRDSPASLKRNRTLLDVEDEGEEPEPPVRGGGEAMSDLESL